MPAAARASAAVVGPRAAPAGTPTASITHRVFPSAGGVFVVRLRTVPRGSVCRFRAGAAVIHYAAAHVCGGTLFAHSGRVRATSSSATRRWTVRVDVTSGARTRHFAWVITVKGAAAPNPSGTAPTTPPPSSTPPSSSTTAPSSPCAGPAGGGKTVTTNWAGYTLQLAAGCVNQVGASWQVPTLNCAASATSPLAVPSEDADWVGVDGTAGSVDLLQTGTASRCVNGEQVSHAWYEDIQGSPPAPEVPLFAVSPGDAITASVSEISAGLWQYSVTDETSGTSTRQIAYAGPGASADWIEEDPAQESAGGGVALVPFANFGAVSFSSLTINGAPADLTAASASEIIQHGALLAAASPTGTDSFVVTYR
jgi:hypothetical protein